MRTVLRARNWRAIAARLAELALPVALAWVVSEYGISLAVNLVR